MPGTIEVVIGPMRSNKTAELIRRVAMREEYAHQAVILFKPKDDTKSAQGVVQSRNQSAIARWKPWNLIPPTPGRCSGSSRSGKG